MGQGNQNLRSLNVCLSTLLTSGLWGENSPNNISIWESKQKNDWVLNIYVIALSSWKASPEMNMENLLDGILPRS